MPSFAKSLIDIFSPTSWLTISINLFACILSVIFSANLSLSTANAWPAGTLVSSAVFINKESNLLNSSFNNPQAFVTKFDLK